ncbi:MAG TPA: porin, partial [Ignavibacteria bacterium]|nr:hypothetical protein [Bacteroidota bacterium]HRI86337.1 porin [Ignavibacteria bacterium]
IYNMDKLFTALLLFFAFGFLNAQTYQGLGNKNDKDNENDNPPGKVWGLVFFDYFYKTGGDSTSTALEYTGFNKDFNSFEFRRIFLGYDHNISDDFFARFVLAYDGNDKLPNNKRAVLVKDAFLTWKEIFSLSNLTIGLQPTPSFSFETETFWGYRSIEKTSMDLRSVEFSRDLGVSLNGNFDSEKNFGYSLMVSTGTSVTSETNKQKKIYGRLAGNFAEKKITAAVNGDYEPFTESDKYTLSAFLGFNSGSFYAGAESFYQENKITSSGISESDPLGISLFLRGNIYKEKVKFFTRFDYYNENSSTAQSGFNEYFVTAGIEFLPHPKIHIMPNLWLNAYSKKNENSEGRKTDVVPRITVFYDYR